MDSKIDEIIGDLTSEEEYSPQNQHEYNQSVKMLLNRYNFDANEPPSSFPEIYYFALIEFGLGKKKELLDLFKTTEIYNISYRAFENKGDNILFREGEQISLWKTIDESIQHEFALFSMIYDDVLSYLTDKSKDSQLAKYDIQNNLIKAIERFHSIDSGTSNIWSSLSEFARSGSRYRFGLEPRPLKVFISSVMTTELVDLRDVVQVSLKMSGIDSYVYEKDQGARPDNVVVTSLEGVESADVYVGLFSKGYGKVTAEEYSYARRVDKPCFIYIRKGVEREQELTDFIRDIGDQRAGVSPFYFDVATELGKQVAKDVLTWVVSKYREMTAKITHSRVSEAEKDKLRSRVDSLQAVSEKRLPQGSLVDYLASRVREWFTKLGYTFEQHEVMVEGEFFEWIINVPSRRGYDRILVRGIKGEAEIAHVESVQNAMEELGTDEGWIVAVGRVSQAARQKITEIQNKSLVLYTFDELIDVDADFTKYLGWLDEEVRRKGIDRLYVELGCTKEEFDPKTKKKLGESHYDDTNGGMEAYIDRWLDDPNKEHISVLGEFGTGKSWFALHYAWVLAKRYREAKEKGLERPRLPLVIPLRDFVRAVTVESLFSEFFFRRHDTKIPSYAVFEQLNRFGKLLLIFDGFDEMASKVDRQKMINNFWELARVVVPGSKAILTCRTEHFPEAKEGRKLLSAELLASTAKLTGETPQFEVIEIMKFNDKQIEKVLSLRTSRAEAIYKIMGNPQLLDLARRPIMTEYVVEALPAISEGKPIDLARVYLYAVQEKMNRDIKEVRTFTSLADKLYFLCEVSWEMLSTDRMSLNYRDFPERLRRLFKHATEERKDLDYWQFDMMAQTMLIRNADGDYAPAHRSLLEFFVAYKFAAELGLLADDFTSLARQQSSTDEKEPRDYSWSEYFKRETDNKGIIKPISSLEKFISEQNSTLKDTFGKAPLTKAIIDLIRNMLVQDDEAINSHLLKIIKSTCGQDKVSINLIGGNSATLTTALNTNALKGQDLEFTDLEYAHFEGVDLSGTNLNNATLSNARFLGSRLENTTMIRADLTKSQFSAMGAILCVAFSNDGKMIAAGSENGDLYVFDASSGMEIFKTNEHKGRINAVAWRPHYNEFASGSDDKSVKFWRLQEGESTGLGVEKSAELAHSDVISSLCFNPINDELAVGSYDGTVTVWRLADQSFRRMDFKGKLKGDDHAGRVNGVRYSADGKLIACSSPDGTLIAFSKHYGISSNRSLVMVLDAQSQDKLEITHEKYADEDNAFKNIDFDLNGLALALTIERKSFGIWNIKDNSWREMDQQDANITDVRFSPDSNMVASCSSGGKVHILSFPDGEIVTELQGHKSEINSISFDPSGNYLVSGSNDSTIRIWDVRLSVNQMPNPQLGRCLRVIEQTFSCKGLQITEAKGLDALAPQGEGTLGSWLVKRGAILGKKKMIKRGKTVTRSRRRK